MNHLDNRIARVLISDDVNARCAEILEKNDIKVVKSLNLSHEQLKNELKNFDCLITRNTTPVDAGLLDCGAHSLKLVARAGTGVDNVDVEHATKLGILVVKTADSNTISTAELTCTLICAVSRRLSAACACVRHGDQWDRSKFVGCELYGKCLAILGLGRIGTEVARRMRAFGMRIIAYDPFVGAEQAAKLEVELVSDLEDIWPQVDFITLHMPALPETQDFLDDQVLAKCKPGFRLINCARGGIVNEAALLRALESGHCAAAGLDVFSEVKFFEINFII